MRTTVSISPGTMLVVKLHDNDGTELDGEFAIHYYTADHPNALVVREMAGIPGDHLRPKRVGVLYHLHYEDVDPALFDEDGPTRAPLPEGTMIAKDVISEMFPAEETAHRTFTYPSGTLVTVMDTDPPEYPYFATRTRIGVHVKRTKHFSRQGGFEKAWGKFWFPVVGESVEDARQRALELCMHQDMLKTLKNEEGVKGTPAIMNDIPGPAKVFTMPDGSVRYLVYSDISPSLYFAHHNGHSIHIKEGQFFADQGGFWQEWGGGWFPVFMNTMEEAREEALKLWEARDVKPA